MVRRLLTATLLVALSALIGSFMLRDAPWGDTSGLEQTDDPAADPNLLSGSAEMADEGEPRSSADRFAALLDRRADAVASVRYDFAPGPDEAMEVEVRLAGPDTRVDARAFGTDVLVFGDELLGPTTVCRAREQAWRCADVELGTGPDADRTREEQIAQRYAALVTPPEITRALRTRLDGISERTIAGRRARCALLRATPRAPERELCIDAELGIVLSDDVEGTWSIVATEVDAEANDVSEADFIPPA